MCALVHQHPTGQAGSQQVKRAGITVVRQADTAEPTQYQQHHKRPGTAQCAARRSMGMLHAVEHTAQVKQPVAAGYNAQAPDVPPRALRLPAEPEQHTGKNPLRNKGIAAAQQLLQQKFHGRIQ